MKNLLLTLLFTLLIITSFAQDNTPGAFGPAPYRKPEETIGDDYLVLNLPKNEKIAGYGYIGLKLKGKHEEIKNDIGGKILKLISIDKEKERGYFKDTEGIDYEAYLHADLQFLALIYLRDFEDAKKLFLNKPLWMSDNRLFAVEGDKNSQTIENVRLDKVTVIDIKPDGDAHFLRFTLKTEKGEIGERYTTLSGTNTNPAFLPQFWFNNIFFTEDPRLKYKFTPEVWKMVKAGYTKIGMPMDAFKLVMGLPKRIHTTKTAKGTSQQWVYGSDASPTYYYFEQGKLVLEQD